MSTRSSARNLFPPLDNPEHTIRRRSRTDPTLLNDFEMVAEGNGDPPVHDLQTMKELCQPSLNGRGGDDANKHLDKFLHVTYSIKVNGVTNDALHLYLFPHSLTHHATAWFNRLPRNSIITFEQMTKMFLGQYFLPFMVTKLRNEITNFRQHLDESLFDAWERYKLSIDRCPNNKMLPVTQMDISITSSSDTEIAALKAEMVEINKNLMRVLQVNQQVKAVTPNCETYGGPHSYSDCPATVGKTQNVYAAEAYQGTLPSNTITNPKEDLKGITTRSGTAYLAWDRFKDLIRACPHHGFSKLHQLDTFYNALNSKDQDSLNSAGGGNLLDKMPRECLAIIESKSKVRYSHNKPLVAKVSTNTSTSGILPDVAEHKDMVKALLFDKKSQNQAPAIVKAVEEVL
nr:reverse transcriptase domain-containing protein [Tanacetum cinerariifolium]